MWLFTGKEIKGLGLQMKPSCLFKWESTTFTKIGLNKQIWVFWVPVFEKKSNWIWKNIFFTFSLSINPSSISQIRSNLEFLILHLYVVFAMSQIQISGLLLHLRDKACIILFHHTQPQNTIFHQFKGKTVSSGSWLTIQPKNITVDKKISQKILLYVKRLWPCSYWSKKKFYSSNSASGKQFYQPGQIP